MLLVGLRQAGARPPLVERGFSSVGAAEEKKAVCAFTPFYQVVHCTAVGKFAIVLPSQFGGFPTGESQPHERFCRIFFRPRLKKACLQPGFRYQKESVSAQDGQQQYKAQRYGE